MLESEQLGHVVRVLRSENKNSKYAPVMGIRYDGLYKVVSHTILDVKTAMYRFKLVREPGQDPIRYTGEGVRPTRYEIKAYREIQSNLANMK